MKPYLRIQTLKIALALFILLAISFSCISKANKASSGESSEVLTLIDEPYGADAFQKMDVYLVANRSEQTPLVILIHGGGWGAGDKKDANFMKDLLAPHNMNVININYRLATETTIHCDSIIKDINAAMLYINANSEKWKIRKDNYVFWGGSAGAHLALLYAYKYDTKNLVSSVITLGAPTKLNEPSIFKNGAEGRLYLLTGQVWKNDTLDQDFIRVSPYYGDHFKPSLLVYGEADSIVPFAQSVMLGNKLTKSGISNQVFPLPNGGHGGEGTSPEVLGILNETMLGWIAKYSK